jgi:hypothetical protein
MQQFLAHPLRFISRSSERNTQTQKNPFNFRSAPHNKNSEKQDAVEKYGIKIHIFSLAVQI